MFDLITLTFLFLSSQSYPEVSCQFPHFFWFCFVWFFWDRYWYYFVKSVSHTQNNNNVDWILFTLIYNIDVSNAIGEFCWTYFFLINLWICYFFFLLYYITQGLRAVLGRSADEHLQLGCKLKGKEFTIPTVNVMWAEGFDRYTLSDHESFLLILLSWFLIWISIENHLVFLFILLILVTSIYWCFNVKQIFAIVPASHSSKLIMIYNPLYILNMIYYNFV